MVGGYVAFLGKTIDFGEYDLVEIFGSFEAADDYVNRLFACGKQIKGVVRTPAGNIYVGNFEPTNYQKPTVGTIGGIISASITRDSTNRTLKLTISLA